MNETEKTVIETHPWEPFIPDGANILIMGTFPPGQHRWSMDFYYPNPINDFWRIMSLIHLGDKNALYDPKTKKFDIQGVKNLASDLHIALNDTGREVRRLRGNASDKFLEILKPVDLYGLLDKMPLVRDVATTGEKAGDVVAKITSTSIPAMGCFVESDGLRIWRMPSTSRAYPMKLEEKASYYRKMLEFVNQ